MNSIKKANEDAKLRAIKLSKPNLNAKNSDRLKAEFVVDELSRVDATRIYLTVKQFCLRHPAFAEGGIRFLIFNEKINGLADSGVVVRMGRKVLINEMKFFHWLEQQNAGSV